METLPLPDGYTELEYIESTGTQYIDTGVNYSPNIKIEATYKVTDFSQERNYVFGLYGANNASRVQWSHSTEESFAGFGSQYAYLTEMPTEDNVYTITVDKGKFTLNNQVVADFSSNIDTTDSNQTIYLFGLNGNGQVGKQSSIILYSFKVYDNGTLIRDFVPVKTSDGQIGLYDKVENKFYGNSGSGTFVAGPEV